MQQENKGVRAKFGGMDVSLMAKMKELEVEIRRLKKRYIDEQMVREKPATLTVPASIKPGLFHGFHARAAKQWQKHSAVQCDC